MRKTYATQVRLAKLLDELVAAGITPISLLGTGFNPSTGRHNAVDVYAESAIGAVDAVVTAHDPTTPGPGEVAQTTDGTTLADLRNQYQAALTAIAADQVDVASGVVGLGDTPWGPMTQAQRVERLRLVLQGILTVVNRQLDREEKTLRALAVLVRRGSI